MKYLRRGFATTAVGIVPPMSWAFERNVFDFHHDPAQAARLLDAAGFPDPDGPGPLPRFRLSLKTSTTEVYRIQAAAIQHDLARVGIALDVRSSEFQTLSADVLRGNFQMYTLQFVGVTDPDILRLVYHSQQVPPTGLNRVRYKNPDVDRLIEAAAAATDDQHWRAFYAAGAAAHCAGRAVHQPLVQDECRDLSARHSRCDAVADRRLHVPEKRVSPTGREPLGFVSTPIRAVAAAVLVAVCICHTAFAANRYDPRFRFRSIVTPRFTIHFHQGEEALARRLASIAEDVADRVARELGTANGRVHVILVDQHDLSNGWANPVPYNVIEISAAAPSGGSTIGNTDDWLRLVLSHEYTHIVHLDKARGWIGGLRAVFGHSPFLYPNLFLPLSQIEGLAVYNESVLTGQGRIPSGDFRDIIDRAALSRRFDPVDRTNGGLVDWPGGAAHYVYGAYFHKYLADRFGAESIAKLADETSGRVPYFGAPAYRKVFKRSLGELWEDFEADARARDARRAGNKHAVDAPRVRGRRRGIRIVGTALLLGCESARFSRDDGAAAPTVPRRARLHRGTLAVRRPPPAISWSSIRPSWCTTSDCNQTSTPLRRTVAGSVASRISPGPRILTSHPMAEPLSARFSPPIGDFWRRFSYQRRAGPRHRKRSCRSR